MSTVIPRTYAEWRHCIEVDCGLVLAPDYISMRLMVLHQPAHEEVRRFVKLYGPEHWARIQHWFEQALQSVTGR